MTHLYWGIDIGGTNVKLGLIATDGKVVSSSNFLTHTDLGPDQCLENIVNGCQELATKSSVSVHDVKAFGVGSPGPLSQTQGKLFRLANLPKFEGLAIIERLSEGLHCSGTLDNDVNMHCWGEYKFGAGRGAKDLVHFALGTGIGGGIICDGQLIHGSEGNAAELGHMIIEANGRRCACGQQGCFEAYASANSIVLRTLERLDAGDRSILGQIRDKSGSISCKGVFEHARQGDALAIEIVDGTAKAIAIAAINMRHVTEPQRVTLSGGVFKAGDFLLKKIETYYDQLQWTLKSEPLEFRISELGDNAGVLGAAGLAMEIG
jgi:glucokinase